MFCAHLRDALKIELQKGNMKSMKSFVQTCFTEHLLSSSENAEKVGEDVSNSEGKPQDASYLFGLGATYKFPGDAKKYANGALSASF
jgi:hypothetical protein